MGIELPSFCCYTPAVMMYWIRSGWLAALLFVAGLAALVQPAVAADDVGSLQILPDASVIECNATLHAESKAIAVALKDGITGTTVWHLQVARVRQYWLNDTIADISVTRRVKPDLLSRSWQLIDDSSGISRRVYQLGEAVHFLSSLEQFPVLDRSLLTTGIAYRMSVKVEVHYGEIKQAWWSDIWHPAQATLQQDFRLQ